MKYTLLRNFGGVEKGTIIEVNKSESNATLGNYAVINVKFDFLVDPDMIEELPEIFAPLKDIPERLENAMEERGNSDFTEDREQEKNFVVGTILKYMPKQYAYNFEGVSDYIDDEINLKDWIKKARVELCSIGPFSITEKTPAFVKLHVAESIMKNMPKLDISEKEVVEYVAKNAMPGTQQTCRAAIMDFLKSVPGINVKEILFKS